jgi:hypothetical protein
MNRQGTADVAARVSIISNESTSARSASKREATPEEERAHRLHMLRLEKGMSRGEMEQEEARQKWSAFRRGCATVAESKHFDMLLSLIIAFNFCLMIVETDQNAECAYTNDKEICSPDSWLEVVNDLLLTMYTLEAIMKLYAWRMEFFWMSRWNNIDFAIVIMGLFDFFISKILGDIIPNMSMLRMFRIVRLVRAVRILTEFKELYLMIHGFASAMMSMFWGFIMMALLLTVWSILAVEIIHPSNLEIDHSDRPWCEDVFSSVMMSNLMFFSDRGGWRFVGAVRDSNHKEAAADLSTLCCCVILCSDRIHEFDLGSNRRAGGPRTRSRSAEATQRTDGTREELPSDVAHALQRD